MTTVQCPRCGLDRDIPLVAHHNVALDYATVCTTPVPTGGRCGTSLHLTVTAHLFPAAPRLTSSPTPTSTSSHARPIGGESD